MTVFDETSVAHVCFQWYHLLSNPWATRRRGERAASVPTCATPPATCAGLSPERTSPKNCSLLSIRLPGILPFLCLNVSAKRRPGRGGIQRKSQELKSDRMRTMILWHLNINIKHYCDRCGCSLWAHIKESLWFIGCEKWLGILC